MRGRIAVQSSGEIESGNIADRYMDRRENTLVFERQTSRGFAAAVCVQAAARCPVLYQYGCLAQR